MADERHACCGKTSTGEDAMQLGIHLPHAGSQATPALIERRVRLGTSVIVLPMRHPLPLAKELSTLHNLSGGRLILGVGVGWLEAEFAALGVPFQERGRRMDEGIAMMRAVWSRDPVTFEAKY